MEKSKNRSANIAVFILFFGVAALESFHSGKWDAIVFWFIISIVFIWPDILKKKNVDKNKTDIENQSE